MDGRRVIVFDTAVQTAAADAGVSSVFAGATVEAVAPPVAAQTVSTKSPTAYEEDECDGGCIAFILIVCVMLPLCCLCGIVYLCRKMMCKKKDEGTKVAPAAKPDKAPAAAYSQQQTMTITIPPGAAPGAHLRITAPSGQPIDIVVPPGAGPGTQLQVPVPAPQPVRQPAPQPAAASATGNKLAFGGAAAGAAAGADAGAASASFGALQIAQQRNCASVSLWT